MSNTGNSIKDEPIREVAGSALTSSYQPLGGPLTRDVFRIVLVNYSYGDVYISTDGVTDMKKMSAVSGRTFDDKTNDMYRKAGTQFYVRYAVTPGILDGWVTLEVEFV